MDPHFETDDFEQGLLASAKEDALAPDRKAKLAAALGVGIGVGATVASVGAAKAATAAVASSKAKLTLSALAIKWLAGGVVVSAVVVAGATTTVRQVREARSTEVSLREQRSPAPTSTPIASQVLPVVAPAPPVEPAPEREITPAPATPERVVAPSPSSSAISASPRVDVAPEVAAPLAAPLPAPEVASREATLVLAREQQMIVRARTALAAGDVAGANRALDEHDATFPNGAFAEESSVLRIDALARSGQRAAAQRAARAFLARSPASPYAARLRDLAGEGAAAP
jgi:hypothetical protein